MLERFKIDDGRHLPDLLVDEDASAAAGIVLRRAVCSCGWKQDAPVGTREEAFARYLDHARTRLGPTRGPDWLPVGVRIALLLVAMVAFAMGCYVGGLAVISRLDLTGPGDAIARVTAVGLAFSAAFTLMVAARHYIAPTRA
ncbi:hypothetical protein [Streptomyces canus]|uniref:hypothetical protein n=1 Tax=Streptomyces canus TaxID=58343 RepID=UPI002E26AC98